MLERKTAKVQRGQGITIDLNCDMGEGMDTDAAIFPFISSANIACGAHAGDDDTMRRTVELALRHGVAIGAHPSYPDRAGFGRTDMLGKGIRLEDVTEMMADQLFVLQKICEELGTRLHHVKPHGALYNRAAKDVEVSDRICQAMVAVDASLLLYGLSGSLMKDAAFRYGLTFISEVFADRTYQPDGSLTPRTAPNALIDNSDAAMAQVVKMVRDGKVTPVAVALGIVGVGDIALKADTVCLHGDGAHAVEFAAAIRDMLFNNNILIKSPKS